MYSARTKSVLRVSLLVVATALVFDSGICSPITRQLAHTTYEYIAAVGASMSASVPENQYNTLTAQISAEQERLNAREQELNEREIAARTYESDTPDYSTYILSVLLFIILVLLVLNYILDWERARMYTHNEKRTT